MQSTRHSKPGLAMPLAPAFPDRAGPWGAVTRARLVRALAFYGCVFALAVGLMAMSAQPHIIAFALGLPVPGGGFLLWAGPGNEMQVMAIGLFGLSIAMFVAALIVWFATGNIILPVAVWLLAALGAANAGAFGFGNSLENIWPGAIKAVPLGAALALVFAFGTTYLAGQYNLRRRARLSHCLGSGDASTPAAQLPPCLLRDESRRDEAQRDELSRQDLQLMRLLLDRALQPVEAFDGFEWVDQFQTAAVRYQLNFMSYALSIAQSVHMPAFSGYLQTAQDNLAAKLLDHRLWRYWKLENIWGNLRLGADPIARDNIMLSGFLAAQIAYASGAAGRSMFDAPGSLAFEHPSGARYAYSFPELIDVLMRQYRTAQFGLLACEPNWIYPLCNTISASAIRAGDATRGTSHWNEIESGFRHGLETEFITPSGRLIPCRSSCTGFAVPPIGGVMMQAFPCLFLNTILPDIAQRQWQLLRRDLHGRDLKRSLWPVDIGNYGFSRASSYAASAAAAVEMGDTELARRLFQHLDEDNPVSVTADVAQRSKASLWAHAVEFMARSGRAGALRSLVAAPRPSSRSGPYIGEVTYPDVLVAKAAKTGDALHGVFYPGAGSGFKVLHVAGLKPNRSYLAETDFGASGDHPFEADQTGKARLNICLSGRTELRITPTS